jgi:hypothetical protein
MSEAESTADLISEYEEAAMAHRTASREGFSDEANDAYDRLASVIRELRGRSDSDRTVFLELLHSPRLEVRGWAAAHALEFAPESAELVLQEIADGPESLEEFSARMVLEEWRSGRLRFP